MKSIQRFFILTLLLAVTAPGLRAATMGIQESAGYTSRIKGNSRDKVYASTTDAAGNVYVVGLTLSFGGPGMNIDVFRDRANEATGRPGLASQDSLVTGSSDAFIIKYDRDGNVVWKRSAGSSTATGVTVDATGNVFLSGVFSGTATFGNLTLTATARSNANFNNTISGAQVAASTNVFVAMLDRDGLWQWVRQFDFAVYPSTDANVNNLV